MKCDQLGAGLYAEGLDSPGLPGLGALLRDLADSFAPAYDNEFADRAEKAG